MESRSAASSWKSNLLASVGATGAILDGSTRPGAQKYGAALLLSVAMALGNLVPSVAHAAPVSENAQAAAAFAESQSPTANIRNQFGQTPSWSTSSSSSATQRISAFESMLKASRNLPFDKKVEAVNDFYNHHVTYMEDIDAWGQKDYWATPYETLSNGAGDCEDFAIAKYFALEQLGVSRAHLKITYVQSGDQREAHMVLLASDPLFKTTLVLDNMAEKALSLEKRKDLSPVYSFNEDDFFYGISKKSAGGIERMGRWTELLQKVGEENRMLAESNKRNPYDLGMTRLKGANQAMDAKVRTLQPQGLTPRARQSSTSGLEMG